MELDREFRVVTGGVPIVSVSRRGTILFTGATASLRGSANFANLAVPKFGLRALAREARLVQPDRDRLHHPAVPFTPRIGPQARQQVGLVLARQPRESPGVAILAMTA